MSELKTGDIVLVSDFENQKKVEKIFMYEYKGKFYCCDIEDDLKKDARILPVIWNYCEMIHFKDWDLEDFKKALIENFCFNFNGDILKLLAYNNEDETFAFISNKDISHGSVEEMNCYLRKMDGSKLEKRVL